MKATLRRLFTVCAVVSAMLCVTVCILWARDQDYWDFGPWLFKGTSSDLRPHRVQCVFGLIGYYHIELNSNRAVVITRAIDARCWLLASALALLPAARVGLLLRSKNRYPSGHCP